MPRPIIKPKTIDQNEEERIKRLFLSVFDNCFPKGFEELVEGHDPSAWAARFNFCGTWIEKVAIDSYWQHQRSKKLGWVVISPARNVFENELLPSIKEFTIGINIAWLRTDFLGESKNCHHRLDEELNELRDLLEKERLIRSLKIADDEKLKSKMKAYLWKRCVNGSTYESVATELEPDDSLRPDKTTIRLWIKDIAKLTSLPDTV